MINQVKNKIQLVIDTIEGGKFKDYGRVCIAHDGPGEIAQISYGILQSSEYASLHELIESYVNTYGQYSKQLKPYLDKIGKTSLVADGMFIMLLRDAGKDETMIACQDEFFDKHYWEPMINWATKHEFKLNLSYLVLFDSFIQSGSILWEIRDMFSELTPDSDGDEKEWVKNYAMARKKWKETKSAIVAGTHYREDTFQLIINADDWDLVHPVNVIDNKGNTISIII